MHPSTVKKYDDAAAALNHLPSKCHAPTKKGNAPIQHAAKDLLKNGEITDAVRPAQIGHHRFFPPFKRPS
jgi:hypothetical protein